MRVVGMTLRRLDDAICRQNKKNVLYMDVCVYGQVEARQFKGEEQEAKVDVDEKR